MHQLISLSKARMAWQAGATLLDIRDELSFSTGHVQHAQWLNNHTWLDISALLEDNTPILVLCYHGHNSQGAAAWIAAQGFNNVASVNGGFAQWQYEHSEDITTDILPSSV